MITCVRRNRIDIEKYDRCIASAQRSRIYAYSWYLDILTDSWDVLVLDNYVVVMPLPKKKRYGIEFIYQPEWSQQLGVFSSKEVSQEIISLFVKRVSSTFMLYYNFNAQNLDLEHRRKLIKINYELNLNRVYNDIYINYRKDRKKSLRKALDGELYFDDKYDVKKLIQLYQEVFSLLDIKEKSFLLLEKLITFCTSKKYGFQRNVYMCNKIVARGFFISFQNRIYYLFGASNKVGKKNGATVFMIDSVIKQFAETDVVFDFEGSSIPSVGDFYKSFGSKNVPYPVFEPTRTFIFIRNLLKRIL